MSRISIKRLIACILAVCILFTSISWDALAVHAAEEDAIEDSVDITEGNTELSKEPEEVTPEDEIVEERTEYSTTYNLGDSKKMEVLYGSDVRFEDEEGNLIDYDPSLVEIEEPESMNGRSLEGYSYTNAQGDRKNYIPEEVSESTPILLEKKGYSISFYPVPGIGSITDEENAIDSLTVGEELVEQDTDLTEAEIRQDGDKKEVEEKTDTDISSLTEVVVEEQEVIDLYGQEERKAVMAIYENKDVRLEYESSDIGVKENIVLDAIPRDNKIIHEFQTEGLNIRKNVLDEGFTFYDKESGEMVGGIMAPYMNDATNEAYSDAITCEIVEKEASNFQFIMTVDQEYLLDKERVYPVTIDPTVTWTGKAQVQDPYVCNGGAHKDYNFNDSSITVLSAGHSNPQGMYRNYMKFVDLEKKIKGYYVDSAKLTLYESGGGASGKVVKIDRVAGQWDAAKITWNNQPVTGGDYGTITTKKTDGTVHTLDLSKYAREVASGQIPSYGIMLRAKDEAVAGTYAQFYNSRALTTARRPNLTVVYYDGPTTAATIAGNPVYMKPGTTFNVAWTGIESKSLNRIEYRVAKRDCITGDVGDDAIVYDSTKSLGKKANGNANIPGSNTWKTGCWRVYIRGVDNGGIKGTGKGINIHIDGTAPVLSTASLTTTDWTSNQTPTLTWKASDAHFSKVQYQINGGSFADAGTAESGSKVLPASGFLNTGTYTVGVRAVDKAGNMSAVKNLTYKVDRTGPVGTISLTPQAGVWTDVTPTINFTNVSDAHSGMNPSQVQYCMMPAGQAAGTFKAVTGFSLTSSSSPYAGKFQMDAADQGRADGSYTIYVRFKDNAGNTSTQQISYKKDKDKPTGTISLSKDINHLTDTVQITTILSDGTGSGVKNSGLTVKNPAGSVVETIYDNFTTTSVTRPFNTRNLPNGTYKLELTVTDNVDHTAVITQDIVIENPMLAPKLTGSNRNDGKAEISWSIEIGKGSLAQMEYLLLGQSEWKEIPNSGETEESSKGAYTFVLPSEEKTYRIKVRGVDGNGVSGDEAEIDCIYDKTKPNVKIHSLSQGLLKGTVTDAWLATWKVEVKEKEAKDSDYKTVLEGKNSVENANLGVVDIGGKDYIAGKTYVFRLVASDEAGNIAEETFYYLKQAGDVTAQSVAPKITLKKPYVRQQEDGAYAFPLNTNYLELSIPESVKSNTITWYIGNQKVAADKYHTDNHSILDYHKIKDGKKENESFTVAAATKNADGSVSYSSKLMKNELVLNLLIGMVQKENVNHTALDVSISEDKLQGIITKSLQFEKSLVGFTLNAEAQYAAFSGILYYVQTDGSGWKPVNTGTYYLITDLFPEQLTVKDIKVKAELKREQGKDSPILSKLMLRGDVLEEEKINLWELDNYLPSSMTAVSRLNYKTYLTWNRLKEKSSTDITKEKAVELPDDVSYQIYRATNKADLENLSKATIAGIHDDYYSEININYGKQFYYRVRAIREKKNDKTGKTEKTYSNFSDILSTTVVDGDEYTKLLGTKEYWDYENFSTPNGTGNIEKSQGNFVYSQIDAVIANEKVPVNIERVYNSQASAISSLGQGWNHNYDVELLNINKKDELIDRKAFRDASGTIFVFEKMEDGTYASSMGKYITLKEESKKEMVEIPAKSGNDKISVEIESTYTMVTKDNLEYRFNSGGQMIYLKEPNGNFVLLTYDGQTGRLLTGTTNQNLVTAFGYEDGAKKKADQIVEKALKDLGEKAFEVPKESKKKEAEGEASIKLEEVIEMSRVAESQISNLKVSVRDVIENLLLVRKITLPDGTCIAYEYDKNNQLKQVNYNDGKVDGESVSYNYDYNDNGQLAMIKDAKGNPYKLTYQDKKVKEAFYPSAEGGIESIQFSYEEINDNQNVYATTIQRGLNGIYGAGEFVKSNRAGNILYRKDINGVESTYNYEDNLLKDTTTQVDYQELSSDTVIVKSEMKSSEIIYDPNQNMNPVLEKNSDNMEISYEYENQSNKLVDDQPTHIVESMNDEILSDDYNEYDQFGNIIEEEDYINGDILQTSYYAPDSAFPGEVSKSIEMKKYSAEDGTANYVTTITTCNYAYDENGIKTETETSTTDGQITISENKYDSMGNLIYVNDGKGTTTSSTFDYLGREILTNYNYNGVVSKISKEYDLNGMIQKEEDQYGVQKIYEYDSRSRLIKEKTVSGNEFRINQTRYSYEWENNEMGEPELLCVNTSISPGGSTTVSSTNQSGWIVKESAGGLMSWSIYDRNGKAVEKHGGDINRIAERVVTMNLYDQLGRVTDTIINPVYDVSSGSWKITEDSIVTKSTYDEKGNQTMVKDGKGYSTKYGYDIAGNLSEVILEGGEGQDNVTTFITEILEPDGIISSVIIDANGNISKEYNDTQGRKVKIEDQGDGEIQPISTIFSYDDLDRVIKENYSNGCYKIYTYDGKNRLTQVTRHRANDIVTAETQYTYSVMDQRLTMEDFHVKDGKKVRFRYTAYTYDILGQLVGFTEYNGADIPNETQLSKQRIFYDYDLDGRITKITYPETRCGEVKGLEYSYDENGWLNEIYAVKGWGKTLLHSYTYLSTGEVCEEKSYRSFMEGSKTDYIKKNYTYDEFLRLIKLEFTDSDQLDDVKEAYTYTYDKNSNIITESMYKNFGGTADKVDEIRAYEYDSLGRIISVSKTDNKNNETIDTVYAYDKVGNRIRESENNTVTVNVYNSLNQLQSAERTKGTAVEENRTYIYDQYGNLIKELDDGNNDVLEYAYDVENRLEKATMKKGDEIKFFQENLYNGDGQRIQKKENRAITNYYYQESSISATTDGNEEVVSHNLLGGQNDIIASGRNEGNYKNKYFFYNQDCRNSTTSIWDQKGKLVQSYSYSDFGKTKISGGVDFSNEVCYTGGIYDINTGLYYLNARYYEVVDGRFITRDTYRGENKEPTSMHLYTYTENDPINHTDPTGNYKRNNAVKYAGKYWLAPNSKYRFYGNDCANFVSQCLFTGGMTLTNNWYARKSRNKKDWEVTPAWRLAYYQYKQFATARYMYKKPVVVKKTNLAKIVRGTKYIRKGDLLYFSDNGQTINHATIISKVNKSKGIVYYSGHTNPRWNQNLSKSIGSGYAFIIRLKNGAT